MNWPPGPRIVSSILGSLGLRAPRAGIPSKAPKYAVRPEEDDLRFFTVRGGHLRVTDALVHLLRELPEPMGLVLVEADTGCEWVGSSSLLRRQVLEAVVSLRDVLGRGPLDFAAFSPESGTEVYLDRWGTLEVRVGSWKETALCRLLEAKGFRRVSRMSVLPPVPEPASLEAEETRSGHERRLAAVCVELGLTGGLSRPVPGSP